MTIVPCLLRPECGCVEFSPEIFIIALPFVSAHAAYLMVRKKRSLRQRLSISMWAFSGALLLSFAVYLFTVSLIDSYTIQQFEVPENLVYCKKGIIEAYAITSDRELTAGSLIIKQLIGSDGEPVKDFDIIQSAFPLCRGQQAKKIVNFNCGGICEGAYNLVLATAYRRITMPVTCDY